MTELDKDSYDGEILEQKGLAFVDFWSDSCEECMDIMPEVEALEQEYGDKVRFYKVNIKGNRRLAIREKVMGLPTILLYEDGTKQGSFSKEIDIQEVKDRLRELIGE